MVLPTRPQRPQRPHVPAILRPLHCAGNEAKDPELYVMAPIEHLPTELLVRVGELADNCQDIACLARANRRCYGALNPILYKRNAFRDHPADSCLLWAAKTGCLETIKLGHFYGADLNGIGMTPEDLATVDTRTRKGLMRQDRETPLQVATRNNNLEIVEYLLKNGAPPNVYSRCNCCCMGDRLRCPLHEAFHHCPDDTAAEMLIEYGAYLEGYESPAIHVATHLEKLKLLKALLKIPQVTPNARDNLGNAALHLAAGRGYVEVVKLLLAQPDIDAGAAGEDDRTPLHWAAGNDRLEITKLLLERPDVAIDSRDAYGCMAIECAISGGSGCSVELLEALLCRLDLNDAVHRRGLQNALFEATHQARVDLIKFLLDKANVGAGDKDSVNYTPLHIAVQNANKWVSQKENDCLVSFLLQKPGVKVDQISPWGTPLLLAVKSCNDQAVKALLDHGADPSISDCRSDDGLSLLHHCFRPDAKLREKTPDRKTVQYLVDRKANLDKMSTMREPRNPIATWRFDGTPLFFATVFRRDIELMRVLLEAGVRPDSMVFDRLHYVDLTFLAALFLHDFGVYPYERQTLLEISDDQVDRVCDRVMLLLSYGARLDDQQGQSALEYACKVAAKGASRHGLLSLLLANSSSRNVSLRHVQDIVQICRKLHLAEVSHDPNAENCQRIIQKLCSFIDREF